MNKDYEMAATPTNGSAEVKEEAKESAEVKNGETINLFDKKYLNIRI